MAGGSHLRVTEPGVEKWWVANCRNTILWIGGLPPQFSVFLSHPDPDVLSGRILLLAAQPIKEYAKTITLHNFQPANGYILELCNIYKSTHVYVTSQPFEIRPPNSPPYHKSPPQIRPAMPDSIHSPSNLSIASGHSGSSVASAKVSAERLSDGAATHFTFEFGGPYVAGLLAAGLLCDGFKDTDLRDVEGGTADGWVRLEKGDNRKKGKFTVGDYREGSVPASPSIPVEMDGRLEDGLKVGIGSKEDIGALGEATGEGSRVTLQEGRL